MSNNEKAILQRAMRQIKVPEEEALTALRTSSKHRKSSYRKFQYKLGEIILYCAVIMCLLIIGSLMLPKMTETNNPATSSSTLKTKEIPADILQSTKYWKVENEENYYSFSNGKVRIIMNYFTRLTPEYTFKENQLDISSKVINDNDEIVADVHTYLVKMDGANLVLEPKFAEIKRLVLKPHNEEIFPYTEETIKKLTPAINPDLTKYSSWTSIIKGNAGLNSNVTFDGFLRKEKIDGEDSWLTTTYEIKENHLLINYGGYTVGEDMYWDGENIILWPVSNSSQNNEEPEYKEESVTIMKPVK